ncbi:MAG: PIN domain-containing protein, partial [Acidobacteriota bacterium]
MPAGTPRVVLDLNVLVSGLLAERSGCQSHPACCLAATRRGTIALLLSPGMLARLRRVLSYPKLAFSPEAADQASREIAAWLQPGRLIPDPGPPAPRELLCPDREDDAVLRTALAGGAHALVT